MKGIVNSTQGVESAKSTGQGWLARMTKKRWVAVVSLSLCFVFCMSFGLQQVLKSKEENRIIVPQKSATQALVDELEKLQEPKWMKTNSVETDELLVASMSQDQNFFEGLLKLYADKMSPNLILEYVQTSDYAPLFMFDEISNNARLGDKSIYIDNTTLKTILSVVFQVAITTVKALTMSGVINPTSLAAAAYVLGVVVSACPWLVIVAAFIVVEAVVFACSAILAILNDKGVAVKIKLWIVPIGFDVR
ncbi:MAG: hypothetical protein FWD76_05785 [Firmicutes bacterium]|nr:hypothetical protein [Bacillota bacterium]